MASMTEIPMLQVVSDIRPARPVAQKSADPVSTSTVGGNLPVTGKDLPSVPDPRAGNAATRSREVHETVQNLNDFIQRQDRALQFEIDDITGDTVIKVMDSATDEVIRQIPSEELLALARRMMQMHEDKGNLFQDKV
ncbi:MAG TPA: flagellar protein FlaG [Gammaproteobacteria bacterium]|nr:flagellar protein FlaG [Gammaproteobacteria bacterium]